MAESPEWLRREGESEQSPSVMFALAQKQADEALGVKTRLVFQRFADVPERYQQEILSETLDVWRFKHGSSHQQDFITLMNQQIDIHEAEA